jgi:hypothetical protein
VALKALALNEQQKVYGQPVGVFCWDLGSLSGVCYCSVKHRTVLCLDHHLQSSLLGQLMKFYGLNLEVTVTVTCSKTLAA